MTVSADIPIASAVFALVGERHIEMTPGTEEDEPIWLEKARRGNGEAIEALVERYSPGLIRYLIRLSGDRALAEDMLQDTWLRVMEHLDSFRPGNSFRAWLYAIARNRAFDILRQRSRHLQNGQGVTADRGESLFEEVADPGPSILEQIAEEDLTRYVLRVMQTLPLNLREVLALRFEQELEIVAIARVLGLSPSAVKDRLYRGLDLLRLQTERLIRHE